MPNSDLQANIDAMNDYFRKVAEANRVPLDDIINNPYPSFAASMHTHTEQEKMLIRKIWGKYYGDEETTTNVGD